MTFKPALLTTKVKFLFWGGVNTLLTYLLYLLLLNVVSYQICYIISYLVGILFSYYANSKFVFSVPLNIRKMLTFPFIYVGQYGVGTVILWILVAKVNIAEEFAPILVMFLLVPLTYLFTKLVLMHSVSAK